MGMHLIRSQCKNEMLNVLFVFSDGRYFPVSLYIIYTEDIYYENYKIIRSQK